MSKPDFVSTAFRPDRKKAVKKLQCLAFGAKDNPVEFRENLAKAFYTPFIPNQVEYETRNSSSVSYDVLAPQVFVEGRMIFYVHGGSFIADSSECWRPFCASLAHACSARLYLPNYRPAPSFAFPCSLEDIQDVFRKMYETERHVSREIIVAADGSGASLALALMLNLKEHIYKIIKQIVLFSPWLDISGDSLVFAKKKNADEVLSGEGIKASAGLYTFAANLKNPLVSPLHSPPEKLAAFPPVYIQMGGKEILLPDVKRFCGILESQSVPFTLDVEESMMHMFQMADEYLEESHLAVERLGKAVKARSAGQL